MLFVISCTDHPDKNQVRVDTQQSHRDYLGGFSDRIFAAGPYVADDGEGAIGSLLIVDFPDRAAAESFSAGDPFTKAGIFADVDIRAWRKVRPAD